MELYSATKKKEILLFAGKWMELENIILGEVSYMQKHVFTHVEYRHKTNIAIL
jgi:hypothetical protein